MQEKYFIKQNLYVRAAMFTSDELSRQRRLGVNEIDEDVLKGLIVQREKIEAQKTGMVKTLVIALFLGFVAWNGGNIQIPGTGASIAEVPAFLELSLIAAAFSALLVTYCFITIQIYSAVISSVTKDVLAKNTFDPDLFSAANTPTWLYIKYSQYAPVIGRTPGFMVSKGGRLFFALLTGGLNVIILILWFLAIASIIYMAHYGLSDTLAGWAVYSACIAMILVSFISMLANVLQFKTELDFNILERIQVDFEEPLDALEDEGL